MLQLSKDVKIDLVAAAATSAGTDVNGSALDLSGFDGVMFFCTIATANAGNYLKAQEGDTSSPAADLAGTKTTADDGADVTVLDIVKPMKRYIRAVVVRGGANTVTGDVYAIRYRSRSKPLVNDVLNSQNVVSLVSPVAGTP